MSGWLLGWRVPGVLEQRLQDSVPIFRPDLFLVDHFRDHLLSNVSEGLLFTVENRHTWLKVTEGRVLNKQLKIQRNHKAFCVELAFDHTVILLTCVHGAAQLDEALEGEVGDV